MRNLMKIVERAMSFSEIDLLVQQVRKLGHARIVLLDPQPQAVIHFEIEGPDGAPQKGMLYVEAKPGVGSRKGVRTLFAAHEVLESRARAAAIAQSNGKHIHSLQDARRILGAGVGNNAIRRFLNPDAFDVVGVKFEGIDWTPGDRE